MSSSIQRVSRTDLLAQGRPSFAYRLASLGGVLLLSVAGPVFCTGCETQVGIVASPAEIYVEVGGFAGVRVLALMDTGSSAVVSGPLTISSDDEAIAVVSGEVVGGVAEGTATLAITDGVFSTTAIVHVLAPGTVPTELVATPASVSCTPASGHTQLEVFAVFTVGAGQDITGQASYSSNNTSVAVITTEGTVVCAREGQAVITVQYRGASVTVNVAVGAIPPTALSFSPSTLTCEVGEVRQVQVLASWEDGSTTDVSASVLYSSSDEAIAAASEGQVQCVSEGYTTITADLSGFTDVLDVEVQAIPADPDALVDLRIIPSSVTCGLTEAAEFAVIAEYGDARTEDVTANSQTGYSISDGAVVLILQDEFVCVQQGQATIEATVGDLTASVTVTVQ